MSALIIIACVIMAIILAFVLVAKSHGTDLHGLLSVDSSKYFKIIDDIK